MQKLLIVLTTAALTLNFSSFAFAGNAVSEMAITKGGQRIAECAKQMNKGISECAQMTVCQESME